MLHPVKIRVLPPVKIRVLPPVYFESNEQSNSLNELACLPSLQQRQSLLHLLITTSAVAATDASTSTTSTSTAAYCFYLKQAATAVLRVSIDFGFLPAVVDLQHVEMAGGV